MKRTLPALVCTAIAIALPSAAIAGPYEGDAVAPLDVKVASKRATVGADGLAVPPPSAPKAVVQIIRGRQRDRAQALQVRRRPRRWTDSGYDCSGSVSYALHGAGLHRRGARLERAGRASASRAAAAGSRSRATRARLHGRGRPALRHQRAQADGNRWTTAHALAARIRGAAPRRPLDRQARAAQPTRYARGSRGRRPPRIVHPAGP